MIAWGVLLLWPVVAIVLFQRLSLPVAVCVTVMGGYLLLPNQIFLDLPLLPSLSKNTIPSLVALLLAAIAIAQKAGKAGPDETLPGWLPRSPVILGLLALLIVGAAGSVATNGETLVYGHIVLQGLQPYDFFSITLTLLMILLPIFLGRRVLASEEGQRVLLLTVVLSSLIYTVPALYEIRMSPQLHMKIYGFFQHTFAQHVRNDGFRPVVFLGHGLELSILLTYAVIGAVGLFRATQDVSRLKWIFIGVWLFAVLVLSKSLGALLIVIVLLPIAFFCNLRTQLLVAACIAGMVLTYPVLRGAHMVPIDRVMEMAENIDASRARSFQTRIDSEEVLLEKALQKPVFGWGGWGRNRAFDEDGYDRAITDGSWILELGLGGWVRYIGIFGLLCWPAIGLFLRRRAMLDPICVSLALILAAKLVDLVPNSGVPSFIFLIVGSLIGRLEMASRSAQEDLEETGPESAGAGADTARAPTAYAREFPGKTDRAAKDTSGSGSRRGVSHRRLTPQSRYRR